MKQDHFNKKRPYSLYLSAGVLHFFVFAALWGSKIHIQPASLLLLVPFWFITLPFSILLVGLIRFLFNMLTGSKSQKTEGPPPLTEQEMIDYQYTDPAAHHDE